MADGVDHKYQGKFLQFAGGKWEQYNSDMPGTAFLVITSSFQLQYRLDDRGLVTKKTLVIKIKTIISTCRPGGSTQEGPKHSVQRDADAFWSISHNSP